MDNHLLRFQEKKFLFYDFETFNLNLHDSFNLPWQIAVKRVEVVNNNGKFFNKVLKVQEGDSKAESKDFYLEWDSPLKIGEEAKRITRYSERIFQNRKMPQAEVFKIIYPLIEECDYMVGHNILGFDIFLLRNWYKANGKSYSHLTEKSLDTFAVGKAIALDYKFNPSECSFLEFQLKMINIRKRGIKTSLSALGKQNSVEHDYSRLHDAKVDIDLNHKVWDKLKYQIDL